VVDLMAALKKSIEPGKSPPKAVAKEPTAKTATKKPASKAPAKSPARKRA
jgi:DNA end-binding protein Ku